MSEDSCKWGFVYELQQIRIMGHRYPRRKIRINKIGIYDTRKHAEQALQDYVQQEKRNYSCWDKAQTYYADCLGYYIVEYRVCASLEQYSKDVQAGGYPFSSG